MSGGATRAVRFGLSTGVYPSGFPDGKWFGELPARIEAWGFDDVVCYVDRPTWPHPVLDPLVLLSIAAATTRSADLIGMVVSTQRVPLILAKQMASIDYVAGGRVILGLALGGDYPGELRACGVDRSELVRRMEDSLRAFRGLWSGEPLDYHAHFETYEGTVQLPRPTRGAIPLWLAHRARSAAAIRRTALHADGWMPSWVSPRRLQRARAEIHDLAREAGRDLSGFQIGTVLRVYIAPDVDRAAEQVARFRVKAWGHPYEPDLIKHLQVVGPPEVCRARVAEYIAAGSDRIVFQAECPWPEFEDQLRMIRGELLDQRAAIAAAARDLAGQASRAT